MNQAERELFKRTVTLLEQWKNCDDWTYPDVELTLTKKNTDDVIGRIKSTLADPQPCQCIDPPRCDTYDRCCKQEIV